MLAGLTLIYPSTSRLLVWPWALGGTALWLAPVLVLLVQLVRTADFRLPSPLVTSGILLLAMAVCLSAAVSPFSAATLPRVWPTLGGCAFYLLLHDIFSRRPESIAPSARTLAVLGAVIAITSVVLWRIFASTSRNAYPFGHSNYTAGFIVLLAPWLVLQISASRGALRVVWIATLGAALYVLYGTSSRAGVLALIAGAALAAGLALVRAPWSRGKKLLFVAAFAGVALAAVLTNSRLRTLVLERSWSDSAQASNVQRTSMLQAGRLLADERFLLGWGPGSVPLAYPQVRASAGGGVDNVLQLHSTPLQLLATVGTTGIAAALMVAIGTIRTVGRRASTPWEKAAMASLGGYFVVSLTDHQLDVPAISALAVFGLAVTTAPSSASLRGRSAVVAILGIIVIGLVLPLQRELRARHAYSAALDSLDAGDIVAGLAALDRATALTPHDPYFQHQAAGALLTLRDTTTDPARRLQLTRDARARLEHSLATGVHLEFPHFNLGWLCLELNEPAIATRHFVAAAELVPDKGGVYLGLGLALLEMQRPTDAIRAFALEVLNDPRSAVSPAWETPALASLQPAVRTEAAKLYLKLTGRDITIERTAAWAGWWAGEGAPASGLWGFSSESRAFVAALPAIAARQATDASAPWAALYRAWLARDFSPLGVDAPTQAALARRAQRHGSNFTAFLRAGTEDEPALLRTLRRSRPGYGMLALHPEGPPLVDLYVVQENVVHADFAASLFPAKGWLYGPSLLKLLPELGPAPETATPSRPQP